MTLSSVWLEINIINISTIWKSHLNLGNEFPKVKTVHLYNYIHICSSLFIHYSDHSPFRVHFYLRWKKLQLGRVKQK